MYPLSNLHMTLGLRLQQVSAIPEGVGSEAHSRDAQAHNIAKLHGPVMPLLEHLQVPSLCSEHLHQ